jgi:ABC-type multidrug transport system fused ATPase/permease subunit
VPETEKKSRRIDWKKTFGLYSYLGKYRKIFIPSVVALFVTGGLSLAFPYFLGSLIGSPQEAMQEGADPSEVGEKINKVVSTLLVILCVQAFVAYWRVRGFIKAGESALCDLRQDVFARLVRLPMPWFMERRTGEVGSRFSADLAILQETLITTGPTDGSPVSYFFWRFDFHLHRLGEVVTFYVSDDSNSCDRRCNCG